MGVSSYLLWLLKIYIAKSLYNFRDFFLYLESYIITISYKDKLHFLAVHLRIFTI